MCGGGGFPGTLSPVTQSQRVTQGDETGQQGSSGTRSPTEGQQEARVADIVGHAAPPPNISQPTFGTWQSDPDNCALSWPVTVPAGHLGLRRATTLHTPNVAHTPPVIMRPHSSPHNANISDHLLHFVRGQGDVLLKRPKSDVTLTNGHN